MKIKNVKVLGENKISFSPDYYDVIRAEAVFSPKPKLVNVRTRHSRRGGTKESWQPAGWDTWVTEGHAPSQYWFRREVGAALNELFPEGVQADFEPESEKPVKNDYTTLREAAFERNAAEVAWLEGSMGHAPVELLEEILENGKFSRETLMRYSE